MPMISPWAKLGIKYLGAPVAVGGLASSVAAPAFGEEQYESDRDKWERIELGHMAGGGALGGLLGLSSMKHLAPGKLRMLMPLIGALGGAAVGAEVTAPEHYKHSIKQRAVSRMPYPSAESARAGVPWAVPAGYTDMTPSEIRRRQILGF